MKRTLVTICLLVTVVAVKGATVTDEQRKVAQSYSTCMKQTGADEQLVIKTRKGQFIEDERLDNFIYCMFRRANFISESGRLNLELIGNRLRALIPEEEARELINTCGYVYGRTPQNAAGNAYRCYTRVAANKRAYTSNS